MDPFWMAATAVAAVAAITDLRSRTIPNWLTYPAVASGVLLSFWPEVGIGARSAGIGLAVGFLPAFGLFVMGRLGGGDAKLLAAIGAWMGFPKMLDVLVLSLLTGSLLAIGVLLFQGLRWARRRLSGAPERARPAEAGHLPFAVPIALGTLGAPFLHVVLPALATGASR